MKHNNEVCNTNKYWIMTIIFFLMGASALIFFITWYLIPHKGGWPLEVSAMTMLVCFILTLIFGNKANQPKKRHIEWMFIISYLGIVLSLADMLIVVWFLILFGF